VNVLIQDAIEPLEELTKLGVPHIMKYVRDDTTRKIVELILSQQVFHRSFIAPPGTTPANLAILRKAFDATMQDQQFLADAKKLRIDVAPLSGARCRRWWPISTPRRRTSSPARGRRSARSVRAWRDNRVLRRRLSILRG
jgi:hypothetical protein